MPGVSIAVIRNDEIVTPVTAGMRDVASGKPVDSGTIFEAASLSKPVFAYIVLQLVDSGVLSLDSPLSTTVPDFVTDDRRARKITVQDVLSHTSGLPNRQKKDVPIKTYFDAGERFSYSGEAYVWLQRVVEQITGEDLNVLASRLVFEPLEMHHSSFVWRADFAEDYALPYDNDLSVAAKRKPGRPIAAATLHTTAGDYIRFVKAVMDGARLKPATAQLWLHPDVPVSEHCIECLNPEQAIIDQHVAWGLGWGLEPAQGTFFHWGDNGQFKAFVVGSVSERNAVVVLTNGSNGMAIMPEIVAMFMPGEHPAFSWLDYPK